MTRTPIRGTALAAGLLALSGAASALPSFTFDPGVAGLSGSAFQADNLLITDYARVTNGADGAFSESGFLRIAAAQLGGSLLVPTGLNSTYTLYIEFSGTGQLKPGTNTNPLADSTQGKFTSLTYTLWGVNGSPTFGLDATTNAPTTTATGGVKLAAGSLIAGSVSTSVSGSSFAPSADVTVSFSDVSPAFSSPSAFYNQALSSFINTNSQVTLLPDGFTITQGGGSINFATVVPEPQSYALLLAGLAVVSLATRRRRIPR